MLVFLLFCFLFYSYMKPLNKSTQNNSFFERHQLTELQLNDFISVEWPFISQMSSHNANSTDFQHIKNRDHLPFKYIRTSPIYMKLQSANLHEDPSSWAEARAFDQKLAISVHTWFQQEKLKIFSTIQKYSHWLFDTLDSFKKVF